MVRKLGVTRYIDLTGGAETLTGANRPFAVYAASSPLRSSRLGVDRPAELTSVPL